MSYQDILSLAQSDGWLAVYDPTNTSARTITDGGVSRLADGLGNLPDLVGSSTPPPLVNNAFGSLAGMYGNGGNMERHLRASFGTTISQPSTIFSLAQRGGAGSTGSTRYLYDGFTNPGRHSLFASGATGNPMRISASSDVNSATGGEPVNPEPHLYCATFRGRQSELIDNGQSSHYGLSDVHDHSLTGLTLGGSNALTHHWWGNFGLWMIYDGELSWDAGNRMRDLIHQVADIPYDPPNYASGTRVISVSGAGDVTTSRGSTTTPNATGIASMTKMFTAVVARKYLTTNALLDTRAEVTEADRWSLSQDRFWPGDLVRYRDLIYAMAGVSDNTAPRTIARNVGDIILDGGIGDPYERFLEEMRTEARSRGWDEFTVTQPGGGARLTPEHVIDLVRELNDDSFLRTAFSTDPWTFDITGDDPRDVTLQLGSDPGHAYWMPGFVTGKGGLASNLRHYAMVWDHPDGSEHATVVMDVPQGADRYQVLRRAMVVSMTGTGMGFAAQHGTRIGIRAQDFSREPIEGIELWFHPEAMSAGVDTSDLLIPSAVQVDTNSSGNYYYAELEPNHVYRMEVRWPNPDETRVGVSWSEPFPVPVTTNGDLVFLSDLMDMPARTGMVRILQSDPGPSILDRYVYNETTGDLYERTA